MNRTAALVLAAGKGSRMGASVPKPLVPIGGRPMVEHLLETLDEAAVACTAVVVGHGAAAMRAAIGRRCLLIHQAVRTGTADAVACAARFLEQFPRAFVLVGDAPLLRAESLRRLHDRHRLREATCSFLTATFPTTYPYARVLRSPSGRLQRCVEERDATPEQRAVREYMTSHFLFETGPLLRALAQVEPHPVTGERYLTDVIDPLLEEGARVEAVALADWRELVGLNTPADVAWAEEVLRTESPSDARPLRASSSRLRKTSLSSTESRS